ncbi:MAG TPA: hypothetical protein DDW84_04085 [Phycisphaerales bacterium]|nr:MAG: hypothetical protein A2Y13_04845 [Planctomycetes bacterium GWC2_45_44]HBG78016.1 hypothetical protein [Phycisphaerales bacterium]HBR18693.1 hypothetical protein [Phycisphaerales bacterium]
MPKPCRTRGPISKKKEKYYFSEVRKMKKLVLVLAIALIAAPSFGAVTMTLTQVGDSNVYNVNYATSDANLPRAFALTVSVAGGGKISAVTPTMTGQCTEGTRGYGIFPGTIDINGVTGFVNSYGSPVAPSGDPGAAGTGLGTSTVVLEMGSLYVDNNTPAASGILCTVTIDCNGATVNQTLSAALESTYRGGVVMEDGDQPAVTIADATYTGCVPVVTECYAGMADYAQWVDAGKPNCWCYVRQCKGDADGLKQGDAKTGYYYVGTGDLTILTGAWKVLNPPFGPGLAGTQGCADFDHLKQGDAKTGYYRVGTGDLTILTTNWKVLEPTFGPGVAPTCLPGNRQP